MQSVRHRKVFYLPGYDPVPPRRYRELCRVEGAKQAEISGYDFEMRPKSDSQIGYGWATQTTIDGHLTHADFEFLAWSDIVKSSMERSIFGTYVLLVRTAWTYIASGALGRLMKLRKGPIIAALYPIFMLLLQLCIALILGGLATALCAKILPNVVAIIAGVITVVAILMWFRKRDGKFFAYYLMHDYAYSAQFKGANPAPLERRMDGFADLIADALKGPYDEVLVVGHSSGAHLGASILADLKRAGRLNPQVPLSFLTLGQVIPMVSFLPNAERLRADLQNLSEATDITWVDITAPGDGCTFALCDPVAVTGVATDAQTGPLILSAAYTQTLSAQTLKANKWRFFRLHFQYLCAFDYPKDYDYFQVTGGPITLQERFAHRVSSRSRIATPVSKYTSMKVAA